MCPPSNGLTKIYAKARPVNVQEAASSSLLASYLLVIFFGPISPQVLARRVEKKTDANVISLQLCKDGRLRF